MRRWRLKMCLDDLKTTLDLDHRRCKSPVMIRCELLVLLIAHNFIRWIMAEVARPRTLRRIVSASRARWTRSATSVPRSSVVAARPDAAAAGPPCYAPSRSIACRRALTAVNSAYRETPSPGLRLTQQAAAPIPGNPSAQPLEGNPFQLSALQV